MELVKRRSCPQEFVDDILLGARNVNTDELICFCRDGQVGFSKFYLGLLSPVIFHIINDDIYSALGQIALLLPDFAVQELEQLRNLPLNSVRDAASARQEPSSALLQTLAVQERFKRTRDKLSPHPSPRVSPLSKKVAAASTAAKPLASCYEYIPDIYSIELFEPNYYLEDCEIQNEDNLSLTIHNGKDKHGAGQKNKKSKRTHRLSRKGKIAADQISVNKVKSKLVLKLPKKDQDFPQEVTVENNENNKSFPIIRDGQSCNPGQQSSALAGSRKFSCTNCGKSFKKTFQLENHLRIHTGDRPFVCHTCGKAFSQEASLRTHMRIHSGSKPHACKECGESFVTAFALVSHLQWRHNEGIRPFMCSFCSKSFPTKQALSKHETIHRMEKKYSCCACDKKFARPDHLKSHMRTHPTVQTCSEDVVVA
jgi:DNA-directed RNA polymerase subunit RPC12/RpoP